MDFRILDVNDAHLVKKVAQLSRYGAYPTIVTETDYHRSWIRNSDSIGYTFGAFDGNELTAVIMTTVSTGSVCWYASLAFYPKGDEFPYDLLAFANMTYLEKGYKRFMLGSDGGFTASKLESLCGLKSIVEISLPLNTRPKYNEIWENVMMKELFPRTYYVYHFFEHA